MLISAYLCINIFGNKHIKLVDTKGNLVMLKKIGQKKLYMKETNNSNLDSFKQEILFELNLGR